MLGRIVRTLGLAALLGTSAQAQLLCHAENDGPNYDDGAGVIDAWFAIRFQPSASWSVQRIEVFTGEVTAGSAVEVWSHDPVLDLPFAVSGTGAFTIQPTIDWQGADLDAPVGLVAGETYWIVWRAVQGCQPSLDLPMAFDGQDTAVSLDSGMSWNGPIASPNRHWKFKLYGTCCSSITPYCTAGTSTSGCQALLAAGGIADANAGSGFVVTATTVEGQKQGLFFYGLSGSVVQPWGSGGSSFLCVKPPTQRVGIQSSGGSIGLCNGMLSIDFNTFIATTPGALGTPFAGGETVWIQAWYRDPPAVKTTNLSDAIEFGVCP